MSTLQVLYTYNVTIAYTHYEDDIKHIPLALEKTFEMLHAIKVKAVFFIDILLLLKIKEQHPSLYDEIKKTIQKLDTNGHNLELFINPIWETEQQLHQLDQERIFDFFAQGKYILQDLTVKETSRLLAIRVADSQIQPFQYLKEIYQVLGIKIEASILPRLKYSDYLDFSLIKYGEIVRFSDDPSKPDRFGKYLGLSRGILKTSVGLKMLIAKEHKKILANKQNVLQIFMLENNKSENDREKLQLVPLPIESKKNLYLLSPDVVALHSFKKIMEKQRRMIKHICTLESFLENASSLTKNNLEYIIESPLYTFVSLEDIIKKYSTTYNIRLK